MDKFYNQKLKINKAQNLNRLDQALVKLSKKFTRSQIKSFIKNHNITKNGIIIKNASHKVKQNEEYILNIPTSSKSKFEPENIPLDIIYEDDEISERHRHRYEVNNKYEKDLSENGIVFSGYSPDGLLPEIVEITDHPWFIGVQFHPELKSKPFDPHPLFKSFISAAKDQLRLV